MNPTSEILERVNKSSSEHHDGVFTRLFRYLLREDIYFAAYQKLYANSGAMTPGSDNDTADGFSAEYVHELIEELRSGKYKPKPVRREYIKKQNGKMRPLGIPSFRDKLLQEAVRMFLEAIYEPLFYDQSHGFRPERSCHTALDQIKTNFRSVKWFIEGDIKGCFDNIDHAVLIKTLEVKIKDSRFINIIRAFLKAGYVEDFQYHTTISGTPQGGIISPILANIYLHELDRKVMKLKEKFDKQSTRHQTPEYLHLAKRRQTLQKKIDRVKGEERELAIKEYKAVCNQKLKTPARMSDDKKLVYCRYADDFLIGIIGSKQDAIIIKEDIKNFLYEKLALTLSDEKTLITHAENAAKFLGYEIFVRKSNDTKRSKYGVLRRVFNKRIQLALGKDTFKKKLLEYRVLEIKIHNGKEYWKAKSRPKLSNNNDFEILDRYNKEIKGIYNYYCLANNCSSLSKLGYIMKYSMYKTFAQKYRTTMSQIRKKYTKNGLFSVRYYLKNGTAKDLTFYHGGFKKKNPMNIKDLDNLPKFTYHPTNTSLIDRLKAEKCELCGAVDKLVMHHVRKLKNLQGKTTCEKQMMARKRKTIAICGKCYKKLSNNE